MSTDAEISQLKSQINELDQPQKSSDLIDYMPNNNVLTSKELAYIAFLVIFGICFLTGFGLIIYAYIQSNNDKNMVLKYEKLLENRTFELVCYTAANVSNPCNTAANPAVKLINWQLNDYFNTIGNKFPCLEVQNKIVLNTPTPLDISMTDANDLFGMGPLIFPNILNTLNLNVNTGPRWLQSQIRMVPNTHLRMAPNANLFVAPDNMFGIQIQMVNFNDDILSYETLDYCQSHTQSVPVSDTNSILNASPLFMYYNQYSTSLDNTIPSFSICTCLMNTNTNLWTSYCVPGTDFILST